MATESLPSQVYWYLENDPDGNWVSEYQMSFEFDPDKITVINMNDYAEIRITHPFKKLQTDLKAIYCKTNQKDRFLGKPLYVAHSDKDRQFHAQHLNIYNHGVENRLLKKLEAFIKTADQAWMNEQAKDFSSPIGEFANGFLLSGDYPSCSPVKEEETTGDFPHLMAVIGEAEPADEFVSFYPYFMSESCYEFELHQVLVWENGLEATLIGEINHHPIAFFDNRYIGDRSEYQQGQTYKITLQAHAYKMQYSSKPKAIKINNDYQTTLKNSLYSKVIVEETFSMTVNAHSYLLGDDIEKGHDDYVFGGVVEEVTPMTYTGLAAYQVMVRVWEDKAFEALAILVVAEHWLEKTPPKKGDQVTGSIWLTGDII